EVQFKRPRAAHNLRDYETGLVGIRTQTTAKLLGRTENGDRAIMHDSQNRENGTTRDKVRDISRDSLGQSRDNQNERKPRRKTSSRKKTRALSKSIREKRGRAIMGLSNEDRKCSPTDIEA